MNLDCVMCLEEAMEVPDLIKSNGTNATYITDGHSLCRVHTVKFLEEKHKVQREAAKVSKFLSYRHKLEMGNE